MEILRIPRIMQDTAQGYSLRGKTTGFVPTMGALHEGIPIRALCSGCQTTFQITDNRYLCPRCGKTAIELTSGRELQIAQLEVENATD